MHWFLFAAALAQHPDAIRFEGELSSEDSSVTVQADAPSAWPGTRRARVVGREPFTAWPDQQAHPVLEIDCTHHAIGVQLQTPFPPEMGVANAASERVRVSVRYDLGTPERLVLRRVEGGLAVRRPRPFLERLLAYEQVEVTYTPFASEPTWSTFDISALRAVVDQVTADCGLRAPRS